MKYKDPKYGKVELKHLKTLENSNEDIKQTEEIYEYPSGDIVIFQKNETIKFKSIPYQSEFFIKKQWVDFLKSY